MVGSVVAERAAGDDALAMPVLRENVDLSTAEGFTVLGVDASRAGRIMRPTARHAGRRRVALDSWLALLVTRPTPAAVDLPPATKTLTFQTQDHREVRVPGPPRRVCTGSGQLLLRDGRGMVTTLPTGLVSGCRPRRR